MRILAISDDEAPSLHEYYKPGTLDGYDLIIACGDLPRYYLEFLVTVGRVPVFYVPGNHDETYVKEPPEGCECIDGMVKVWKGLRIVGLGGSVKYKKGPYLYTERQMAWRIARLLPSILMRGGFDILVTHAPPRGYGDFDNVTHRGFACFTDLIKRFRPAYHLHGHIHMNYSRDVKRSLQLDATTIVNCWQRTDIEIVPKGTMPKRIKAQNGGRDSEL